MSSIYTYPDKKDKLTVAMIEETEILPGSWELSELEIIEWIKNQLVSINPTNAYLLDAGCGTGRLIPLLHSYFKEVYAIDPDFNRLNETIDTVQQYNISEKVKFLNLGMENLNINIEFDAIISSHVIQHVHRRHYDQIIGNYYKYLKDNGWLLLMTTNSNKDDDYFIKSYFKESKLVEEEIDADCFDLLINNNQNILPIRFFQTSKLISLLQEKKFKAIYHTTYHKTKFYPNGRDVFIALKKA